MSQVTKRVFCMFGAIGGGAKGFKRATARVGNMLGRWQCIGSVDVDAAANRDFARLIGAPATTLDLADRGQYIAIHGHEPPEGWREATPADIRRAAQGLRPHCVFLSAPCKGFSGLLAGAKADSAKYVAMNGLTERGVWLALEAWADDPPEVILFENVPRIMSRGRAFLDRIAELFRAYGYAWRETAHDCGEIGNLAQSRKRFLGVARHVGKVPAFLYEPPRRPLRAVGDVLGRMHLPGDERAGPMHRVPTLQWKTWVRLAFVEAGSDWRSLGRLAVEDGVLCDYLIVPRMYSGGLGVRRWDESTGAVAGESLPLNGAFSVADVRFAPSAAWRDGQAYGVRSWGDTTGAIAGQQMPGQGAYSVADVRHHGPAKHSNEFRIVRWEREAQAVTSAHGSGQAVADPRVNWGAGAHEAKLRVTDWDGSQGAITGARGPYSGACAVADPRPGMQRQRGDAFLSGGHYGVVRWGGSSGAVSASACHDNGPWSVADPRPMPTPTERLVCRIEAMDGTWHRPFTTLECAALQNLYDPDDPADVAGFSLDGTNDQAHRERIGNAVPPAAAEAVAVEILRTLMLADAGETFQLSAAPVWVRPVAAALAVGGQNG